MDKLVRKVKTEDLQTVLFACSKLGMQIDALAVVCQKY
jgi:hypothetical protein